MSKCADQVVSLTRNSQCLVPKQAWCSLKDERLSRPYPARNAEAGVLRLWTVSKEKPQETFRLKHVGFKALCVLPSDSAVASTTEASEKIKFVSRIVCLFFDGGVGVYNLRNSSWDFLKNMGHLETIFDCQFKPDDPDLLATASFDGTVKVWKC
ncbi:WD repeat-containing protein 17 [Trichonephila clavipes]|nr:WD repeat-containing protein 17 [Trichonephila clavipes]